jgi:hypothetical protein
MTEYVTTEWQHPVRFPPKGVSKSAMDDVHYLLREPSRWHAGTVTLYRSACKEDHIKLTVMLGKGSPIPDDLKVFSFEREYVLKAEEYDKKIRQLCKEHGIFGEGKSARRRVPEIALRHGTDTVTLCLQDYQRDTERDLVTLRLVRPCCPHCQDNQTEIIYRGTAEPDAVIALKAYEPDFWCNRDGDLDITDNIITYKYPIRDDYYT